MNDLNNPSSLPASHFASLGLKTLLVENLSSLGFESMTPIQSKSLPPMLQGQDIIAQAKTGSGKTAAFGLAILNDLTVNLYSVQGLILCPTRELAEQVAQALRQLARSLPNVKVLNLSGGMPMKPQSDSLRHGAHIIVGTPGRIQKHLDKESLSLAHMRFLILDEADRMLDMGFFDAIQKIITLCPKKRKTWLFSATYPTQIQQLAKQFMQNPLKIVVEEDKQAPIDIEQYFYEVPTSAQKCVALKNLLLENQTVSALIFCNTKEQTTHLTQFLCKEGFSAIALNGDMEQIDRDKAMIRFSNHSVAILIATDVAARGLDIKELPLVINYDVAFEHDVHIHRIGRTGRAGAKGLALTITTPADAARVCMIEAQLDTTLSWKTVTHPTKNILPRVPEMITFAINLGKKDKIRPGDILGALIKDGGLPPEAIGKIDIRALQSYVAIRRGDIKMAYQYFQHGTLKGRKIQAKSYTR